MTRERFLTVRWNNWISLVGGIILLTYVVFVVSTAALSDSAAFIGLAVLGVLYWLTVEGHTAMRFAWQKKNSPDFVSPDQGCAVRLLRFAYNTVWWVPIVLPLVGVMDYRTGFMLVIVLTLVRLAANVYVNNTLTAEQAEGFPFRA